MRDAAALLAPPDRFIDDVLETMLGWRQEGLRAALVTLIGIEGASPRPIGSQMAVNENGAWVGQLSSDCAEAAIAAEALVTIDTGLSRTVRYGRGSKYIDVKLPCGSGIDVHFDPNVPLAALQEMVDARRARLPVSLFSPLASDGSGEVLHRISRLSPAVIRTAPAVSITERGFERSFAPATRIVIVGRGPYVVAMADIANTLDWDIHVSTPDTLLVERLAHQCRTIRHLSGPRQFDTSVIDSWTATVLMFHSHEWEPAILARVLEQDGFYVGALGSRRTHTQRLRQLQDLGVNADRAIKISGPVGLDIGAQTPPEIALSIASEILVARRGMQCSKPD